MDVLVNNAGFGLHGAFVDQDLDRVRAMFQLDVAHYTTPASLPRTELAPAEVARIGLDAMFAGKSGITAGRLNKVMALAGRVLPRNLQARSQFNMATRQAARG